RHRRGSRGRVTPWACSGRSRGRSGGGDASETRFGGLEESAKHNGVLRQNVLMQALALMEGDEEPGGQGAKGEAIESLINMEHRAAVDAYEEY
ncbi:unnamed protein product, partial [Discosporangium mesarthrocarpum]